MGQYQVLLFGCSEKKGRNENMMGIDVLLYLGFLQLLCV